MNKLTRFDWYSLILYIILVVIGLVNIYSTMYNSSDNSIALGFIQKQVISFGLGIVLICIIQFFDTRFFERYASIIYLISIASLIGLWFFGTEVSGARSWYGIGGFSLQPSEFAKVAVALALAKFLGDFNTQIKRTKDYLGAFLIMGIPAILTLLQPDPGTALVLLGFFLVLHSEGLPSFFFTILISLFVLFISTLLLGMYWVMFAIMLLVTLNIAFQFKRKRKKVVFSAVITSLLFCGFTYSVSYIFEHIFEQRHRDRFNILLGKEVDTQGIGYNINQSQIAIGSGRFSGKGFLEGTQTKGGFVPEQQTDYIFTTIGEEWGFVGSAFVLLLFVALILRIVRVAYKQKTTFARVYCLGFACTLFIHVAINLGMVAGLIPTIGIPLALMSYGGSSLLAFSIFLGIYLRIVYQRMD
ncbi:MAG: Peptidoglycan glycosyltransferase MrdB [Bacteroidota bacterium]|nr:MAG: Peptidoglycan glycosyltransferase MrdB [Bacteroidota bacterium]